MSVPYPQTILAQNAGAKVSRICRSTGATVTLYDAAQANLDDEDGKWATVCEDHGSIVNHRTWKTAISWLSHPEEWCEDCQKKAKRTTDIFLEESK